jgi:hypothetical protein
VYRKTKEKKNVTRHPKMNLIAFIHYEIQGKCGLDGRFTEGVGWPNLNDLQQISMGIARLRRVRGASSGKKWMARSSFCVYLKWLF